MSEKNTLTVVHETDGGYVVLVSISDGKTGKRKEKPDMIPRELFEAMVRTGYLTPICAANSPPPA